MENVMVKATRQMTGKRVELSIPSGISNLAFTLSVIAVLGLFQPSAATAQHQPKKVIVCSTTQVADFARNIVGDRWEVICVLGPAEDPHTYEVGADDGVAVSRADLCAENGWNLEGHDWMNKLAKSAGKPIITCVNGVEPLKTAGDGEHVYDPHAWFNPKNAIIYVNNICDAICQMDPEHTAEYRARQELYIRQLNLLTGWVRKTVNEIPANQRLLVTHHDAFGYFCEAFNFKSVSPLGWTTAELTEVTPDQRQKVVKQIREAGVKAIFVETSINRQLLEGISRDAGVRIGGELYSDAMGSAGSAGETYIGMIRENVLTIVQALK